MAIISTEAIVLRSMDHRETSKLVFLLTRKNGRVIGVMKGIRKDPRKFGSSADKFTLNDIVFYQYRNSDIHLIAQCDMKGFFPGLREDSRRITAADYAAELVNKLLPLEEPNAAIYDLLLGYYHALSTEKEPSRLVHMFQIKFLALSGFRPHIDSCVVCNRGIGERPKFSTVKGGLVCRACQHRAPEAASVSAGAIATLLYVERNTWTSCLKLMLEPSIRQELKKILNNFLIFHLDKNIRSARFV